MQAPHRNGRYYGDEVRALFFLEVLVIIIAQSFGVVLPLTTWEVVGAVVILAISIAITNPGQVWVHWVNVLLALIGSYLFTSAAVTQYQSGMSIFDFLFVYIETLALLSLVALYFSARTLQGVLQKN